MPGGDGKVLTPSEVGLHPWALQAGRLGSPADPKEVCLSLDTLWTQQAWLSDD